MILSHKMDVKGCNSGCEVMWLVLFYNSTFCVVDLSTFPSPGFRFCKKSKWFIFFILRLVCFPLHFRTSACSMRYKMSHSTVMFLSLFICIKILVATPRPSSLSLINIVLDNVYYVQCHTYCFVNIFNYYIPCKFH